MEKWIRGLKEVDLPLMIMRISLIGLGEDNCKKRMWER